MCVDVCLSCVVCCVLRDVRGLLFVVLIVVRCVLFVCVCVCLFVRGLFA